MAGKTKKQPWFPDARMQRRIKFMRETGLFPEKLKELEEKYGEMLKKAGVLTWHGQNSTG